jgi:hypothetical protein
VLAQKCAQSRGADASEELTQGDFDDGALAYAASYGDVPQFVADFAGKVHRDALGVVRFAYSSRKLSRSLSVADCHTRYSFPSAIVIKPLVAFRK